MGKDRKDAEESREERDVVQEEVALVGLLATYLKMCFIYPKNNERVVDSSRKVLEILSSLTRSHDQVILSVQHDSFLVGAVEVEAAGPLPIWMKDAFLKVAIAGIVFGSGLDEQDLYAFSQRMRQNFASPQNLFDEMWPEPFGELQLMEMVFPGEHRDDGGEAKTGQGPGSDSSSDAASQRSVRNKVLEALQESDEVMAKFEALQERVEQEVQDEGSLVSVDLLARISESLPAEALRDPEKAKRVVETVIDSTERQIIGLVASDAIEFGVEQDPELRKLLTSVSKKFFRVEDPKDFEAVESKDLPAGRPEDEGIQDDLEGLLRDYEDLPELPDVDMQVQQAILAKEFAGVHLYRLVTEDDQNLARELHERILASMEGVEGCSHLLQPYLDVCLSQKGKTEKNRTNWRVIEFLLRSGQTEILEGKSYLAREAVAFAFPELLGPFLDSLDPECKEDLDKIGDVCFGAGPKRIAESTAYLIGEEGILRSDRADKILGSPSREVLPMVRIVAEHGDESLREKVVQFLRGLNLPASVSLALSVVQPSAILPPDYLRDLCHISLGAEERERLAERSMASIREFITLTEGDPDQLQRRIYAIHQLRRNASVDTLELLREVCRAGGVLSFNKSSKVARQAAREVLRYLTKGKEG